MYKTFLSIMLIAFLCAQTLAQNQTVTITVLSKENSSALIGASLYFDTLKKGAVTNFEGAAIFENLPNTELQLTISFLGYETLTTTINRNTANQFIFYLEASHDELDEIVIQSARSSRTIKNVPTRIEFIAGEELSEKAMMNPANISMVLRESTGIQMQQTSLSSGNSNIRIQGLDGRYTQLLRDGFPLYGGFGSGLSILQIPPLDIKQFEIIKGSSSTLFGGGAISGLVNIVSKTPDYDPDLDIMFTQTQALGSTGNVFYSKRNDRFGVSLYGSAHYQKQYDPDDDDFSNLPKTKTVSINPKFYYYPSDKTTFWLGVNGTYDERIGGDMLTIKNGENGIHQFTEANTSKRLSTQLVFEHELQNTNLITLKNSFSFFDRQLDLPDFRFSGTQTNSFTEGNYKMQGEKTDWIFGANLYTVNFNETTINTFDRSQEDVTVGLFAKNIVDLSESWVLETGFRVDYAKDWDVFFLPRLSILYKGENGFSSRIGGGLGYKIPDIFTEEAEFINYRNIAPINSDVLKPERSYGLNLDVNYKTQIFNTIGVSINQLFYVTAIKNGLILNSNSNQNFEFSNANHSIVSKGAETNIKFTYNDFKWFINYAYIDARLNYLPGNPQKPLTAKHNAGSIVVYENEKWLFGYETYYTGSQFLSNGNKTPDFITMGFLGMRNFSWGSMFTNFENFTNKRQSKFSPLVLPPHDNPNFPEIYAPTDGFILSVGIIIKPFGNEHH